MFKFDFDIDAAEDLTDLGDLGIGEQPKEPTPDASKPVLEPFSELSIQHLVRRLFHHHPHPTALTLRKINTF